MCTVTLSYDRNNALARRKLSTLLSSGLFVEKRTGTRQRRDALAEHRSEVEDFMAASKRSMSSVMFGFHQNKVLQRDSG